MGCQVMVEYRRQPAKVDAMSGISELHDIRIRERMTFKAPWYALQINATGVITFANQLIVDLVRLPISQIVGTSVAQLIVVAHNPEWSAQLLQLNAHNPTLELREQIYLQHVHVTMHVRLHAEYIVNTDDILLVFEPISSQSKAEKYTSLIRQFFYDVTECRNLDTLFMLLHHAMSPLSIGVFCALTQPITGLKNFHNQHENESLNLWIFGKSVPASTIANIDSLMSILHIDTPVHHSITSPIVLQQLAPHMATHFEDRMQQAGIRRLFVVSLKSGNRSIGVLGLFSAFDDSIECIDGAHINNLQITIAQLFTRAQLETQITRLERLNHELRIISQTQNSDLLLQHACLALQRIFDDAEVCIAQVQDTAATLTVIAAPTTPNVGEQFPAAGFALHIPQRFTDVNTNKDPWMVALSRVWKCTVLITVPIQIDPHQSHVIIIAHQHNDILSKQDVTYATQFAEFVVAHYAQLQLTAALNASERRYRFLMNEAANPMVVVDEQSLIVHMNHASRRLIGVEQPQHYTLMQLFAPHLQHEWHTKRSHLIHSDNYKLTWQSELVHQLNETIIPVEIEARIISHENNSHEIFLSMRDIRQQREMERRQMLREQDLAMFQHITSIVNSSLDLDVLLERTLDIFDEIQFGHMLGIILIDEHNTPYVAKYRHVEPALLARIQQDPSIVRIAVDLVLSNYDSQMSLYNTSVNNILASDLINQFGNLIGAALSDNGHHIGIILTARPFNTSTPFSPRDIQILHTVANQLSRAITNARLHLSLQQAADRYIMLYEDTEEIRSHLSSVIENSPDVLILCNRHTQRMNVLNRRQATNLGYDISSLQNQPITVLCEPEMLLQFMPHIALMLEQPSYSFEYTLRRGDTTPFTALFSSNTVNKMDVLITIKDITPMRQLEDRIKQREKLAALGQMIAGVAHELNNPIAVIRGITQLQLMNPHDDQLTHDLHVIDQTSQRAGRILKQLRSLAQPQSNPVDAVNLQQLIPHIASQYQQIFIEQQIRFTFHHDAEASYIVLGQEAQIEQVFVNLIDNAIHAMQSVTNQRSLTVSLTQNDFVVTITVDDTGSGINKDVRDRIFDPFYTTRKIGEGLGLGLAIVHTIIIQHHGSIMFQPRAPFGTRFIIEIPTIHSPRIRVAKQTRMSEFYVTLSTIFRELTMMPIIEVESPVEAHDIIFIDESQLGTVPIDTTHTLICVIGTTQHTTLIDIAPNVVRVSPTMSEAQLKQQIHALIELLMRHSNTKE